MKLTDLAGHWKTFTVAAATWAVAAILAEHDVAAWLTEPLAAVAASATTLSAFVWLGRDRGVQAAEEVYLGRLRDLREDLVAHSHEERERRLGRVRAGTECRSPECNADREASTAGLGELVSKAWDASRKEFDL